MLKLNSKKAMQNLYDYLLAWDFDYLAERANYDGFQLGRDAAQVLPYIWRIFQSEKKWEIGRYGAPAAFRDWAAGLALGGLFCYMYNRSAVDDLGAILEETDAEKARFTESQAEDRLTGMLYRLIEKAARTA